MIYCTHLDLDKEWNEKILRGVVFAEEDKENDGEDAERQGGLDDYGCDVGVLFAVLVAHCGAEFVAHVQEAARE